MGRQCTPVPIGGMAYWRIGVCPFTGPPAHWKRQDRQVAPPPLRQGRQGRPVWAESSRWRGGRSSPGALPPSFPQQRGAVLCAQGVGPPRSVCQRVLRGGLPPECCGQVLPPGRWRHAPARTARPSSLRVPCPRRGLGVLRLPAHWQWNTLLHAQANPGPQRAVVRFAVVQGQHTGSQGYAQARANAVVAGGATAVVLLLCARRPSRGRLVDVREQKDCRPRRPGHLPPAARAGSPARWSASPHRHRRFRSHGRR